MLGTSTKSTRDSSHRQGSTVVQQVADRLCEALHACDIKQVWWPCSTPPK